MKRTILSIALVAVMLLSAFSVAVADEVLPLGDANLNGEVEKYDYILVKRSVLGTVTLNEDQLAKHVQPRNASRNGDIEFFAVFGQYR